MMGWNQGQPYVCYPVEDPSKKKKKKKEPKIEYELWDQNTHNKVYGPGQAYYGAASAQYYSSPVGTQQYMPTPVFQAPYFTAHNAIPYPIQQYPAAPVNYSVGGGGGGGGGGAPSGLAVTQGESQRYWVGETDNSWTLRTMAEINAECQPGGWEYGESGFPFFRRAKA